MSYWACAQLEANRERLALHCLSLRGFEVYLPRLRVKRVTPARKTSAQAPALFPGYAFVLIELQWRAARWSPGVGRLVLDGDRPAKVPDRVIAELKRSERDGLVELLPAADFKQGDAVRITRGVFTGQLALFDGQRSHERVALLLWSNAKGPVRHRPRSQPPLQACGGSVWLCPSRRTCRLFRPPGIEVVTGTYHGDRASRDPVQRLRVVIIQSHRRHRRLSSGVGLANSRFLIFD